MATAPLPLPIREDTVWPCGHGYQEAVSEQDDIEPSGLGVPRDKFKNEILWVLQVSPHKIVHSEACPSPRWSLLSTTSQPIQVSKGNSHSMLRLSAVRSTTPWTVLMVRPGLIYGDQNTTDKSEIRQRIWENFQEHSLVSQSTPTVPAS